MAHNDQAEILRRQISDLERLTQHFDMLREKVSDLMEKAPDDPAAAEKLVKLEQAWKNELQHKAEQAQQYMREVLHARVQSQQMQRQSNEGARGAKNPVTAAIVPPKAPPAQKSPARKKTRCFA